MSAVTIRGLRKSHGGIRVLDGLELAVPDGCLTAVLGASGCGKTTLLRVIAGFDAADAGEIELAGQLVEGAGTRARPERRRIGYVPQEGALFPHLNVSQNVAFGLPRGARRGRRVDEMLELVGLTGLGARGVHELSGGQQQRVALARALAPQPRLVLLDEPFGALDPTLRDRLRTDVRNALAAVGATALLVTHDQEEAFSLADEIAILRDGRIAQHGSPEHLYRRPADAGIAEFLGEANLIRAHVDAHEARTDFGTHSVAGPIRPGGPVDALVLVRPEQIRLAPADDEPTARLTGRVDDVQFYGHDARVTIGLDSPRMQLIARTVGTDAPAVSSTVAVVLPECVHVLPTDGRVLMPPLSPMPLHLE